MPATTVLEVLRLLERLPPVLVTLEVHCKLAVINLLPALVQAQESGEHTQIVDDIVYAIDGLGQTASRISWQDSASTLAQICNTRRGRQAFRCVLA